MQLMMYIGNDLIETVAVDITRLSIPGYLGAFKRQLKQKHHTLLQEASMQAEFLVINLNPATNTSKASPLNATPAASYL